ncbi:MAG: hypothetical protein DRJ15_15665, partial [Bacteroidetes bacterium]
MVNPIYIIAVLLGTAFLLGLFKKKNTGFVGILSMISLAISVFISASWFMHFASGHQEALQIFTGGAKPPFSINLQMGIEEALFTMFINV